MALDAHAPVPQAVFKQALADVWCGLKNFPLVDVKFIISDVSKMLSHSNWQSKFLPWATQSSLWNPKNSSNVGPTKWPCRRSSSPLRERDGGVFRSHISTVLTKSLGSCKVVHHTMKFVQVTDQYIFIRVPWDSSILRVKIARVLPFSWRWRPKNSTESYDALCLSLCAFAIKLPRERKKSSIYCLR